MDPSSHSSRPAGSAGITNPFAKAPGGEGGPRAETVPALLRRLRLAPHQPAKDLILWPLVVAGGRSVALPPSGLVWLQDAMEDGFLGVGPRFGHGTEARCLVETRGPAPVLVLAGEPLGAQGIAAETRLLPRRSRIPVAVRPAGRAGGDGRRLSEAFRRVPGQVGFVAAVHGRPAALEILLPGLEAAASLRRRLEAWAPLLLARQAGPPRSATETGPDSPEAFLEAAARWAAALLGAGAPEAERGRPPDAAVALRVVRAGPVVHVVGLTAGPGCGGVPFV